MRGGGRGGGGGGGVTKILPQKGAVGDSLFPHLIA